MEESESFGDEGEARARQSQASQATGEGEVTGRGEELLRFHLTRFT